MSSRLHLLPIRLVRRAADSLVGWAHGRASGIDTAVNGVRLLCTILACCLCSLACEEKSPAPGSPVPAASLSAKAGVRGLNQITCHEPKTGARYLVGDVGDRKHVNPDDEDEGVAIDLPFAVEVGSAVPTSEGFAVAALKGNTAMLVLLSQNGGRGTEIELEQVHGDVQPPKLAQHGDLLIAVIVGNEATSSTLRLVSIQRAVGQSAVTRGHQVSQGRDTSTAFDLAVGASRGLLVWDRWDKSKGHGTIEALSFDLATLTALAEPIPLDFAADDAEAPRVVRREGGFWLTWVSHGSPISPPAGAGAQVVGGGEASGNPELASVVDVTPRRLKIVPLDAAGAPTAAPIMITKPDAHVLAYDVVPFGEGTLLAWRDDPTTLGAEAPLIHLATVSAAGSVKTEVIEDASLAAGTPKLFVDVASKSEPRVWLSAMGNGGKPRMGFFDGSGELAAPLEEVTLLGINEPLALHGGKFLLGRPNGRALDLSVVGCGLLSGASGKF